MWLFILIVIALIAISVAKKGNGGVKASSNDGALFFSYYEMVRNKYQNGSRSSSIVIGSPVVDYNGTAVLSGFLSVFVTEDDNSGAERAQAIGMQTRERNGKFEHQFVIRKRFSKQAKRQLLQYVGTLIQQSYPNDLLKYDDSIPMLVSIVDMKDFIEAIQSRK